MAILISFCCYALLILSLLSIPDRFWDSLSGSIDQLMKKKLRIKEKIPVMGAILRAEELLLTFSEVEVKRIQGGRMAPKNLVRYKFYTELLEQLFESHRRLGIGLKKSLVEIRQGLLRDLQFEKKMMAELAGAFMQFVVIAATTWGFVFLSSSLVKISPHKSLLFLMLFLQILGTVVFCQLVIIFKDKTFNKFGQAIRELYLFSSFLDIGVPLNEILIHSNLMQGELLEHKIFIALGIRTKKLIERLKETGLSPKEELQEIISSLWHLQEEEFLKFTKKVQILKFCILAFFFLPAYFLYLSSIFQFFMEQ